MPSTSNHSPDSAAASESTPASPGIKDALLQIGASLFSMLHTRLALVLLELSEERIRLLRVLGFSLAACCLAIMGLFLGHILVFALLWEAQQIIWIAVIAGLYCVLAIALFWYIRRCLVRAPSLLEESLRQFQIDANNFKQYVDSNKNSQHSSSI